MRRLALNTLIEWKDSKKRKPLIIRGARQVGKTWLMKEFGRTQFHNCVYLNFDENRRLAAIFEQDLNPEKLILALSAEVGKKIDSDDTLLIFDEVQEVPRALTSLKYFYEEAPEYKIVAAGSMLGVALHQGTSFPVGKVSFLDLYPLNFKEFLYALGEDALVALLESGDVEMIRPFHLRYIELLRQYYFVGGMPEAVDCFVTDKDYNQVRNIKRELLTYYQQDFSKHADSGLVPRLNMIWQSIPMQLAKENKKFIYGQIREGARAKDFELAIQWLSDCGLIHLVHRIKKAGLPLNAYMELSAFKIYMVDVGLLAEMGNLAQQTIVDGNRIFTEFKGALTEQYVLQQMIADLGVTPYYYSAENARCEVDYILSEEDRILPVEVKAEENLRSKSLRTFCDKNEISKGIRCSMSEYREQDWMVNIPLYMVTKSGLRRIHFE
ncbi:MAG: ATP-binding protein [Lachnospiraceae bacterium]|nr:ATP-binding protein [Lachnospiraceae bacterium]